MPHSNYQQPILFRVDDVAYILVVIKRADYFVHPHKGIVAVLRDGVSSILHTATGADAFAAYERVYTWLERWLMDDMQARPELALAMLDASPYPVTVFDVENAEAHDGHCRRCGDDLNSRNQCGTCPQGAKL